MPAPDPSLARALDDFARSVNRFFGPRLVSLVLYGSVVFDDLAPGYGDLDFLVVVDGDLADDDVRGLVEMRRPFRAPDASIYMHMLEGAFLPRHMLDPAREGRALWWGTSSEREWRANSLGALVLEVIRTRGIVLAGKDARGEIPVQGREALDADMRAFVESAREHGRAGTLHSVDWLLTAARLMLLAREGRFSSKSEAADWGAANARGAWRLHLPRAKSLRLDPSLIDASGARVWLAGLEPAIRQAVDELDAELTARLGQ